MKRLRIQPTFFYREYFAKRIPVARRLVTSVPAVLPNVVTSYLRAESTRCFVIGVSGGNCHRMLYLLRETVGLQCSVKYSWMIALSCSRKTCCQGCALVKLAARNRTEAHRHQTLSSPLTHGTSLIAASELYCRLHFTYV